MWMVFSLYLDDELDVDGELDVDELELDVDGSLNFLCLNFELDVDGVLALFSITKRTSKNVHRNDIKQL